MPTETIAPPTTLRAYYTPPAYFIDKVDLTFELEESSTRVTSRLVLHRNLQQPVQALVLQGRALTLESITLEGRLLGAGEYQCDAESLTLPDFPESAILEIVTRLDPKRNTSLMGLYQSGGHYFTQCEAEGFRKISYYLDRPDVMARFSTTLIADRHACPVLLSNGNRVGEGVCDRNRHWVKWVDPFRKPSYLFALVAGRLSRLQDRFVTRSGRSVALEIYAEANDIDKCHHAMASLKRAMKWDEDVFGLEYDLDSYMIVAVGDFNAGAMENKGLNIFNTKYVLARPDTATDADYEGIEAVIAHEYFHNWTGNRVTCRDWFQLSLKEGLTVFRDQEFSADMGSRAVKRIEDVRKLRSFQFAEDAGPTAHPIRPDAYMEISNFYTMTVYEKGAEVVRMVQTLLGAEGFKRGMALYFRRHDGQAVTCDEFLAAMADANGTDLSRFSLWYAQAGTPLLTVRGHHDVDLQTYTLTVSQSCPPTPGQPTKQPMHMPLALALLGEDGQALPLQQEGESLNPAPTERVLHLREACETFVFTGMAQPPVPSLLRGFSAPVRLDYPYSRADLIHLMQHDRDPFSRWEAGQTLMLQDLNRLVAAARAGEPLTASDDLPEVLAHLLADTTLDPALLAQMLTLPGETYLADQQSEIDPDAIHAARAFLDKALARSLRAELKSAYQRMNQLGPYRYEGKDVACRRLKNVALAALLKLEEPALVELALNQYHNAHNMTDRQAALACLVEHPQGDAALAHFARTWAGEALVMDKWFALQALSARLGTVAHLQTLMQHPAFQLANPNKVRSLIGAFIHQNLAGYHRADGAGYRFAADMILAVDKLNPQVAARLAGGFNRWRRMTPARRESLHAILQSLLARPGLSRDVYEIIARNLDKPA